MMFMFMRHVDSPICRYLPPCLWFLSVCRRAVFEFGFRCTSLAGACDLKLDAEWAPTYHAEVISIAHRTIDLHRFEQLLLVRQTERHHHRFDLRIVDPLRSLVVVQRHDKVMRST